jgi:uncharacterized membrane protein
MIDNSNGTKEYRLLPSSIQHNNNIQQILQLVKIKGITVEANILAAFVVSLYRQQVYILYTKIPTICILIYLIKNSRLKTK